MCLIAFAVVKVLIGGVGAGAGSDEDGIAFVADEAFSYNSVDSYFRVEERQLFIWITYTYLTMFMSHTSSMPAHLLARYQAWGRDPSLVIMALHLQGLL